jgi:hypothetical protein
MEIVVIVLLLLALDVLALSHGYDSRDFRKAVWW